MSERLSWRWNLSAAHNIGIFGYPNIELYSKEGINVVLGREKSSETARPLKNTFYYPTLNSSSRDLWIS